MSVGDAYSETRMAWKLIPYIQQRWRWLYRLGSELLSNGLRFALVQLTFFHSEDQLLFQDYTLVFRGYAAKPS